MSLEIIVSLIAGGMSGLGLSILMILTVKWLGRLAENNRFADAMICVIGLFLFILIISSFIAFFIGMIALGIKVLW